MAPKAKTEAVRFYAYWPLNKPVNPYLVVSSKTYIDPATRRTEVDPLSVKTVQFNFGHFETEDQEIIDFLDSHNANNPNGSNITREFLAELREGETITEKIVDKKVLPLNVAKMFDKKTLIDILLNEYGFDTDADTVETIISAATDAGVIVE
jgi:hypothetical protein